MGEDVWENHMNVSDGLGAGRLIIGRARFMSIRMMRLAIVCFERAVMRGLRGKVVAGQSPSPGPGWLFSNGKRVLCLGA